MRGLETWLCSLGKGLMIIIGPITMKSLETMATVPSHTPPKSPLAMATVATPVPTCLTVPI